eukprot:2637520-Rhodomonas_salina.2
MGGLVLSHALRAVRYWHSLYPPLPLLSPASLPSLRYLEGALQWRPHTATAPARATYELTAGDSTVRVYAKPELSLASLKYAAMLGQFWVEGSRVPRCRRPSQLVPVSRRPRGSGSTVR